MAQATEALTDTDHAILRAYAGGTPFADIAIRNRMTKDDLGYRLTELCGLDRGAARRLLEDLPATAVEAVPVDLTAADSEPAPPATRVLSDTEQEVMRSYGGGNTIPTIARAKRMEPAAVDRILRLVDHQRLAARDVGRSGILAPRPAAPTPAPRPVATAAPGPAPAARREPAAVDTAPTLSRRQAQILPLLATDLAFEDIAVRLGMALSTAYGLASDTYRLLGAGSRAGAVAAASRLGLLPPAGGSPVDAAPAADSAAEPDDTGPDLLAIIAADARDADTAVRPEPVAPDEPAAGPAPTATAGPTVEITIIRAGRHWTTVVELDPDDVDTTVSVRVRPPAVAR